MMSDNLEINDDRSKENIDPTLTPEGDQRMGKAISSAPPRSGDVNLLDQTGQNELKIREDRSAGQKTDEVNRTVGNPTPSEKTNQREMPASSIPYNKTELPWFSKEEVEELHSRWSTIQFQFVDEPCSAVEQGEALLAETVERIKQMLSDRQKTLEQQWLSHEDITTEELRITLRNYRGFLDRLLSN